MALFYAPCVDAGLKPAGFICHNRAITGQSRVLSGDLAFAAKELPMPAHKLEASGVGKKWPDREPCHIQTPQMARLEHFHPDWNREAILG